MTTTRLLLVGLLLLGLTGCSKSFWYRPRVAGQVQPSPCAQAPAPQTWQAQPQYAQPPMQAQPSQLPPPRVLPGPSAAPQLAPMPMAAAPSACGTGAEEQQVLAEVNAIRQSHGLRPYRWDPQLHQAAQGHSREQNQHGYMGHDSPDPSRRTLVQRVQLVGYPGVMYGEVVAWGYRDARSVVEGWMNSSEHRAILIDRDLTEAAFARVGQYWTGNFGARRAAPPVAFQQPTRTQPAPRTYTQPRTSQPAPRTTYTQPRTSQPPTTYAAPVPQPTPRPQPRVQQYFRPTPQPRRAPVFRPPTRGG